MGLLCRPGQSSRQPPPSPLDAADDHRPPNPRPPINHPPPSGGRTARLVNPVAWERGVVFCQCQQCSVWHTLAANNPKVIEEIVYDDPEGQKRRREELFRQSMAAGEGAGGEGEEACQGDMQMEARCGGVDLRLTRRAYMSGAIRSSSVSKLTTRITYVIPPQAMPRIRWTRATQPWAAWTAAAAAAARTSSISSIAAVAAARRTLAVASLSARLLSWDA